MSLMVNAFAFQAFVVTIALHVLKTMFIAIRSVALRKQDGKAYPASPEDNDTVYKGKYYSYTTGWRDDKGKAYVGVATGNIDTDGFDDMLVIYR